MNYMDKSWLDPLMSELRRKSDQSWTFSENDASHGLGVTPQVRWRKSGWVKGRKAWVLYDDFDQYVLLFSLVERDGAIKGNKGIRPVLILRTKDERLLYKKVLKKPHNKSDARLEFSGARSGQLDYALSPHIPDLVKALISEWKNLMMTLFKVDDVPMLGEEVFEEYGSKSVIPMQNVVNDRDMELIDRSIVVELLGTPAKKAMAVRVAKLARKKYSSSFYKVTFDTTFEKRGRSDVFDFSYPKTVYANNERNLEEFIKSEYISYAKDLWQAESFNERNIIYQGHPHSGFKQEGHRFIIPTHKNHNESGLLISIHSNQMDKEDLLQILKIGSFFSHALRRF